ncbi:MAG TPA: aldolase/citrate lyase family protein [Steroidobacteraceae bacterium]|nr:aldolase/citrate lyase family protein [Steroidobacteraceae bacterium]
MQVKSEKAAGSRTVVDMNHNVFKRALQRRELQIGLWSTLCSNLGAEIIAHSGFEWILLDTEHSPNEVPDLVTQLQAMGRGTASPVVRAAWNDPVLIKRMLDIGAQSILLPCVQTAEEARRAVAAVRYPPRGMRGVSAVSRASNFGRIKDYLQKADEEICLLVQIESKLALEQLEAISTTDGVDGVFIGPADLSASLGHLGDPQHPETQSALQDAGRRLARLGKPAGILTVIETDARRYIEWGYSFVAVGIDTTLLATSADALARKFKAT